MPAVKKEKNASKETTSKVCVQKTVKDAITALKSMHEKIVGDLKKQPLLEDTSECPVFLQLMLKRIPPPQLLKMIRVPLPHSLIAETSEVCLITGDLEKRNHKAEIEPTILHYKDLLKKHGVTKVSEVIPLRQLRTEYKTFESKRQLAAAYDVFLVDKKIAGVLPKTLGKTFFHNRKFPIQIDMSMQNLKEQIDRALCQTEFSLTCRGNSYALEVARFSMEDDAILKNIMATMEVLGKKLPGKDKNILSLYLKTARSKAIPIYVSLDTSNVFIKKPRKQGIFQHGELSTMDDAEVKVFRDGRVILQKKKKSINCEDAAESDEKIDLNVCEAFSDDDLMESEEDTQESISNEGSLKKKRKNKKDVQDFVAKNTGKKKKSKKTADLVEVTSNTVLENEEDNQDFTANEVSLKKRKKGKKSANFDEATSIAELENEEDNQDSTSDEVSRKKKKKSKKSANFDESISIVEIENEGDNQDATSNEVSLKKKKKGKKSANFNATINIVKIENEEDNPDSTANEVSLKKKKGKKSSNFDESINIVEIENEENNQDSTASLKKKKKGKKSANFNETINIVEMENEPIQDSVSTEISSKKRKSEDETQKTPLGSKRNKKAKRESTENTTSDSMLSNAKKANVDSDINNSVVKLNKRRKSVIEKASVYFEC